MLDFFLIMALGFLGSFGHCVGMCGPLTVAFALSDQTATRSPSPTETGWHWQQWRFHLLLNLSRILSYVLVGAGIGALGSVLIAGGQLAGVGSGLRRIMSLVTGGLLIWYALRQLAPTLLPRVPLLNPMAGKLHDRLSRAMLNLSLQPGGWTPVMLGFAWGLVPCGFLYAAQIKAAEAGDLGRGSLTMLAFGLGTLPTMLGVGVSAGLLSANRRTQLFRLGAWVTLAIGILTLLRTGDAMTDYSGHAALICLAIALIARPISRLWAAPLRYRRLFGVMAFVLAVAHTIHMIEHSWGWNVDAFFFMPPQHQWGIGLGAIALVLMLPAALTSFDRMQRSLGRVWRSIHLLSVPALILAAVHTILIGSHYLPASTVSGQLFTGILGLGVAAVLLLRRHWVWSLLSIGKFYVPPF